MRDASDLTVFKPGYLYEPRVLWGAFALFQTQGRRVGDSQVTILPPSSDAYYNGGRWPIVLTKATVLGCHPLGYPESAAHFLGRVPIEIGLAGGVRYSLGEIAPFFNARARGTSREPFDFLNDRPAIAQVGYGGALLSPQQYNRDTLNTVQWDFDHPCMLPPSALVEVNTSGRVPTSIATTAPVEVDTHFFAASPESPGLFPGAGYAKQRAPQPQLSLTAAAQRFQNLFGAVTPDGGETDLPVDPFAPYSGGAESRVYPPDLTFTPKQMVEQKSSFTTPTELRGMAFTFDQRRLDQEFLDAGVSPPGSLACTTLARVRSRNGGTGNWWWEDGLPLAAAFPTQTPALAVDLPRPFVVAPGEALRVTGPRSEDSGYLLSLLPNVPPLVPETDTFPMAVVYLSFCGYAVVEA